MAFVKREIVGEREVIQEWVRKEWACNHVVKQIVFRLIEQHVVLSCGHTLPKGRFYVMPKRTGCYPCTEALENEAQQETDNAKT